jgi:hypothetical protein
MMDHDRCGLRQFLRDYPRMAIRPAADTYLRLKGTFEFIATHAQHGDVHDAFELQIDVPRALPRELPKVIETGGKIPRSGSYHVNGDGTLCLGSQLRLLLKLSKAPTLAGFADSCIIPYLFAVSHKLRHGGKLIFGELDHYSKGMLADYELLFGLAAPKQARYALELLGMKKRIANKLPCPCGCGIRLGKCRFNRRILRFRSLASRGWFKRQVLFIDE